MVIISHRLVEKACSESTSPSNFSPPPPKSTPKKVKWAAVERRPPFEIVGVEVTRLTFPRSNRAWTSQSLLHPPPHRDCLRKVAPVRSGKLMPEPTDPKEIVRRFKESDERVLTLPFDGLRSDVSKHWHTFLETTP